MTPTRCNRSNLRRLALVVAALATLAPLVPARAADRAGGLERKVKAAFVYKFAGYVEWPTSAFPTAETPVTIGVMGDAAMEEELAKLVTGRTSSGRSVAILRVQPGEALPPLHLLFVAGSEEPQLKGQIRPAAGRPILIVTESNQALTHGSMINFVLVRGRVRFEVALDAVTAAGLSLSSRLLAVARSVVSGAR